MENSNKNSFSNSGTYGRVMAGVILVIVGVVLFAKQLGVELPYWLFRWEMFLIVLGIFIGAKHSFKRSGWIIPVLIGVFFCFVTSYYVKVNTELYHSIRYQGFYVNSCIHVIALKKKKKIASTKIFQRIRFRN
jgi:K+ transporter